MKNIMKETIHKISIPIDVKINSLLIFIMLLSFSILFSQLLQAISVVFRASSPFRCSSSRLQPFMDHCPEHHLGNEGHKLSFLVVVSATLCGQGRVGK